MKFKVLIFLLIGFAVVIIPGCDQENKMDETDPSVVSKNKRTPAPIDEFLVDAAPADTSQFEVISQKTAVFTIPDTTIIKELIEKEGGEEAFYTLSDEKMFLQNQAAEFLKSKNVPVKYPNKRYLKFKGVDTAYIVDTQSEAREGWLEIFFDPDKEPALFNPAKVEKEYEAYFEDK